MNVLITSRRKTMDRVIHFEVPTGNRASSKTFYSSVFDWQLNDMPVQMNGGTGTYTSITTVPTDMSTMSPTEPGAINGGFKDKKQKIKNTRNYKLTKLLR